jgi:hypothetical protein
VLGGLIALALTVAFGAAAAEYDLVMSWVQLGLITALTMIGKGLSEVVLGARQG